MEVASYRPQFLSSIDSTGTQTWPQSDSQSKVYLADVCQRACNWCSLVWPWKSGNRGLQSRERLVFPPALCILLLLYPPTRVRLHYLFSHSFTSSNSPSLMVLSSQNINILKNLLSWKRMYPHFYVFLSALSPYFHGRITWTHIMYFLLHFLTSPLLLSPWQ